MQNIKCVQASHIFQNSEYSFISKNFRVKNILLVKDSMKGGPGPCRLLHGVLCKMRGRDIHMRELARINRGTVYNSPEMTATGKSSITRVTIILCAVAGILLGGLAYKAANGWFGKETVQAAGGIAAGDADKGQETANFVLDAFFKAFGMDRYNPITIVNANNPYFKLFYENKYLEYVAEKEQQELQQKTITSDQLKNEQNRTQNIDSQSAADTVPGTAAGTEPAESTLQEVSSSITFEGDVENSDQQNNPVVTNGKIKVVNETSYSIDIDKLLKEPLNLNPGKTGPQIFVYHTHTTESFLKNISEMNNKSIPSRTTDNRYNVVRVGNALIDNLKKYDINVLHNTTVHDKDYNSSYVKSLTTLTSYVNKYPSLKMSIDLHRDAAGDDKLRVVKKINGKDVAQIMFVIGTDSKLANSKWKENLKLALKIQSRLNEIAPGLAKPTYISKNRYNQHLMNGTVIVEIGGDGNVIDECVRSTTYLAQAINDVIYKNKY